MGRKSNAQKEAEEKEADVIIPEVVEDFPVLIFANSGWCNELNKSYLKGSYKPRDEKEYEALKKYAK